MPARRRFLWWLAALGLTCIGWMLLAWGGTFSCELSGIDFATGESVSSDLPDVFRRLLGFHAAFRIGLISGRLGYPLSSLGLGLLVLATGSTLLPGRARFLAYGIAGGGFVTASLVGLGNALIRGPEVTHGAYRLWLGVSKLEVVLVVLGLALLAVRGAVTRQRNHRLAAIGRRGT